MNSYNLADLDELVLRCRDDQAREYIREAVACYKSGAFRACIVAAWIAVVFDIVHKLREMEFSGVPNAKQKLEEFERIRSGGDSTLKDALDFERDILQMGAEQFELFTPLEKEDLTRLQADRNRCAHPSMQSLDEPYQPTPELARCHVRNAVEILLQREPVQGRKAFERICADIKQEDFPEVVSEAVEQFRRGPVERAHTKLVKRLVEGLTCASLTDDQLPTDERRRVRAALGAIIELHRAKAEAILRQYLPKVIQSMETTDLWKLLAYISTIPVGWELLDDTARTRAVRYVERVETNLRRMLVYATQVPQVKEVALARLDELPDAGLAGLINRDSPVPEVLEHAIQRFENVGSFADAESVADDIVTVAAKHFNAGQLKRVLEAIAENSQIYGAGRMPRILCRVLKNARYLFSATSDDWETLVSQLKKRKQWPHERIDYTPLENRIEETRTLLEETTD